MEAARARWPKERRSSGPHQRWLRRDWGFFLGIEVLRKAKDEARSRIAAGSRRPSSNHLRKAVYFRGGYFVVSIFGELNEEFGAPERSRQRNDKRDDRGFGWSG